MRAVRDYKQNPIQMLQRKYLEINLIFYMSFQKNQEMKIQ